MSPLWKPEIDSFRDFLLLKIAHFNGKILPIPLKLNFTPNTLGCYEKINLVGNKLSFILLVKLSAFRLNI